MFKKCFMKNNFCLIDNSLFTKQKYHFNKWFNLIKFKNINKLFNEEVKVKDGLSFMPNRPVYPLIPGSIVPEKRTKRGRPPTKTIADKVAERTFILKNFEMEIPTIGIIAKTSFSRYGICLKENPLKNFHIYVLGMKVREYRWKQREKKYKRLKELMYIKSLILTATTTVYNLGNADIPTRYKLNERLAKMMALNLLKRMERFERLERLKSKKKRVKKPNNKDIFLDRYLKERISKEGFYLDNYYNVEGECINFRTSVDIIKYMNEWNNKFEKELNLLLKKREMKLNEWAVIVSVADGIVKAHGMRSAGIGDLVTFNNVTDNRNKDIITFTNKGLGVILSITRTDVLIGLLDDISVKRGQMCFWNNAYFRIPVGQEVCRRALSVTGQALDNKGPFIPKFYGRVEVKGPDVIKRAPVEEPLITGWTAIDTLIPIGLGQRELILGDRQTGKTTIALDTIYNQKKLWGNAFRKLKAYVEAKEAFKKSRNKARAIDLKRKISLYSNWAAEALFCIYVAVGIKKSTTVFYYDMLYKRNCRYVTFIVACASDTAVAQFMAPYAGCAIGEYLRDNGLNALIVYDDLTKHANAYRQMSLLIRRPPGREAYPGDVFYAHSKLLERSAKLDLMYGGGTLTALPIVEIFGGDYSSYIPTNVISITDGQIFLDTELFRKGSRPAVNFGLSVSRVGSAAQLPCLKQVSEGLKLLLNQYAEAELFAQFTSDLDPDYQRLLIRGWAVTQIINQNKFNPRSFEHQAIIMFAAMQGYFDNIENIEEFERFLLKYIKKTQSFKSLQKKKTLTKNSRINLRNAFSNLRNIYIKLKKANIDISKI